MPIATARCATVSRQQPPARPAGRGGRGVVPRRGPCRGRAAGLRRRAALRRRRRRGCIHRCCRWRGWWRGRVDHRRGRRRCGLLLLRCGRGWGGCRRGRRRGGRRWQRRRRLALLGCLLLRLSNRLLCRIILPISIIVVVIACTKKPTFFSQRARHSSPATQPCMRAACTAAPPSSFVPRDLRSACQPPAVSSRPASSHRHCSSQPATHGRPLRQALTLRLWLRRAWLCWRRRRRQCGWHALACVGPL